MVLVSIFAFAACSPQASNSPSAAASGLPAGSSGPSSSAAAPSSSVDTSQLTIAVGSLGDQTWDPANGNSGPSPIENAIGETLLRVDPTTRAFVPGLAESWTQSPDGLVTTIKLRPNIPFQDGYGNVTAEDVKFTIQKFLGPTSDKGNQMQAIDKAVQKDAEKNVEIVGPLELKITSAEPVVLLLRALANGSAANAMYIQSKKYWTEKADEALLHPIGTGPYKFVSSTPGVEVKLDAVENHWRQTGTYKHVTFKIIPDAAARLSQVQSGAADFAVIPPSLAREAKNSGANVLSVTDYADMTVILGGQHPGSDAYDPQSPWIQADAPAKGKAIRDALNLSIDRQAILDAVLAGEGTPVAGPILQYPKIPDRNDAAWTLPAYNVDLAKQKLAEGGYPNGFEMTIQEYENRAGNGQADVAEAVAGYFEAIGIKVKRQVITDEQSDEYLDTPKSQGIGYVRFDPYMDESLQTFACCYVPTGTHRIQYDTVITEALAKLVVEIDPVKRGEITRSVIKHLIDTTAMLPLFTVNWTVVVGPRVGHWDKITGEGSIHDIASITP
jgi:peptide/nickel transport system substrate-binding protein